jgi:hypothetical protein
VVSSRGSAGLAERRPGFGARSAGGFRGFGGHRLGGIGRLGEAVLVRAGVRNVRRRIASPRSDGASPTARPRCASSSAAPIALPRPSVAQPPLALHHGAQPRDVLVGELRHVAPHRDVHLPQEVDQGLGGDVEFLGHFVHTHPSNFLLELILRRGSAISSFGTTAKLGLVSQPPRPAPSDRGPQLVPREHDVIGHPTRFEQRNQLVTLVGGVGGEDHQANLAVAHG